MLLDHSEHPLRAFYASTHCLMYSEKLPHGGEGLHVCDTAKLVKYPLVMVWLEEVWPIKSYSRLLEGYSC